MKLSFLGLGTMGYPMAGYLSSKSGCEVCVYNRTVIKSQKWVSEYSGSYKSTPQAAVEGADIIFSCVGNDDDLRSVVIGDGGAFHGMKSGAYFVDHTTVSATVTRELSELAAARGFHYIDAPVSGGESGAQAGSLTVMCGGATADFNFVQPYIDCYAKQSLLMGCVGSGQLAKMVNQLCIVGVVQGLAEALSFGMRSGLDMEKVISVISGGAAQSWQLDNRARSMVSSDFDFGFAVDWMRKDLGICLSQARLVGAHLPVAALVDQFYSRLQELGMGSCDTSSLIFLLSQYFRDSDIGSD